MHCNLWSKGLSGALVSWQPITAIQILHRGTGWSAAVPSCSRTPRTTNLHVFLRLELLFSQIGLVWLALKKRGWVMWQMLKSYMLQLSINESTSFPTGVILWCLYSLYCLCLGFSFDKRSFTQKDLLQPGGPIQADFFGWSPRVKELLYHLSKPFLQKSALESYCLFWVCKWICLAIF